MKTPYYLRANWPAPKPIHALTVTYPEYFTAIQNDLKLPTEPIWLKQIHSNICVDIDIEHVREADASVTKKPNLPLVIKTADCLPILLCNTSGTEIAAIHGGWRGLLNGIIENTLLKITSPTDHLIAWTGPAICKHCFEVGAEVFDGFCAKYPEAKAAFSKSHIPGKYFGDLSYIAELILKNHGVNAIYHAGACTFEEKNKYYSYRREKQTGRINTLIWF